MDRWLGKYAEPLLALFRLVAGILFAFHGAQKLFGAFGGQVMTSDPQMLLAGIIEFFGGLLIAVGLVTSWVAFIAAGEMAVAYFLAHAPRGPWPIVNQGELALLYLFAFLFFAARGSGPYSLDALLGRKR